MEVLTSFINSYFHEPHASLLNGILLGRPLFVTNTFYNQLKDVGLIHIVVLSGMNITLLSAIIMNTIVVYVGRKIASLITIVIIIAFVVFVGAEAPIVRAAMMGILSLIGLLYGRRTIALYLLFLSAIIMVCFNREWISSISFQLSFAATLGIILFGSMEQKNIRDLPSGREYPEGGRDVKKQKHPPPDGRSPFLRGISTYLLEELRISLAAQVFTLPIIFWYFRQISFIAPLANILVAWLIAPIMILGILMIVLGLISWQFGFVFSWLLYPPLSFIVWVVENLAHIPLASITL